MAADFIRTAARDLTADTAPCAHDVLRAKADDVLRDRYLRFIGTCRAGKSQYRLTPSSDESPFALCFAVFGLHLLKSPELEQHREAIAEALQRNIRELRARYPSPPTDKAYRQLLALTLSAVAVVGITASSEMEAYVLEQLPKDVARELATYGALQGIAQSGNQAMFMAIFLLHAHYHLGLDTKSSIEKWVDLHLEYMNQNGFWGPARGMTHLQFQNGYHQYEILEYLNVDNPRAGIAAKKVMSLADTLGHFAPYPGGGGCFDYDAVVLLTPGGQTSSPETRMLLGLTAATLRAEQTREGGFAESHYIRPRSFRNLGRQLFHLTSAIRQPRLFAERLRYAITLQRPKHDRLHTHWSRYSREWHEPNLFDSWFRMLTLARIEVALDSSAGFHWGFIDYPGIGFHPMLRSKQ